MGINFNTSGIGLRPVHLDYVLNEKPPVNWLEVHSEQFMGTAERKRFYLKQIRKFYPISLHGVNLSLGSMEKPNVEYLKNLSELIDQVDPFLISEHLAWNRVDGNCLHELLPFPYTKESLANFITNVNFTQDFLKRQILIENPSLLFKIPYAEMGETEFLTEVVEKTGCGLLLDINNVIVSSKNTGFDPQEYIEGLPLESVHEIHLAGHTVSRFDQEEISIDTHDQKVQDETWDLFEYFNSRVSAPVPTLIEWDVEIPEFEILMGEAFKIDTIVNSFNLGGIQNDSFRVAKRS